MHEEIHPTIVEAVEPRKELKRGSEGKAARDESYPRFAINMGGNKVYFELHLNENGASEEILQAIANQRLLTSGTLEQDLCELCKDKPHLIMTMGPFVESQDGLPKPRYLRRAGSDSKELVPPGNEEAWIGFRCVPCTDDDLPDPRGSRESDHSVILPRIKTKSEPVRAFQLGLSEALKNWLGRS